MKRQNLLAGLLTVALIGSGAFAWPWRHRVVIFAQAVPYLATYSWTAPADGSAVSYNCYLDGTLVTNVTVTTCQVSIPTLGAHTAAVTSVNPNDVPTESAQDTLAFTLKQPSSPPGLKVK